jgi:prepilin-type N-terminal cleavage/methylation domain-containing protein
MKGMEKKRWAFSLVELVIVIVILGIIAAIAIPRISSGSKNAGESALKADLASLRNGIDWYYGEHKNIFPGANGDGAGGAANSEAAFVSQMTQYSDADGNVSPDKDPAYPFGPYIRNKFPKSPVGPNNGSNGVTVVAQDTALTTSPVDGKGWVYSTSTGQIISNSNLTGNDGVAYSEY